MIRNKTTLVFGILITLQSCVSTKFDCTDKKACKKIEYHLEVISNYLFYSKENVESVVTSAEFMEKISGHDSEADYEFSGKSPPTINDYDTWTAWYTANYNNLRYNRRMKKVYQIKPE
ncbi:hypothetical protein [Aquimarina brevivitae]|uniref:Lipoprotein n=1 Tax=Aquimarina brevivitae TaxID=323412 RepID=A0A4Q7NUA0_9FLAO|nr:hypothetical protein [Aquimarina brevivitae]RZS90766.1 hypothetical protein EV197_3300 [Aquimarina brevivitae]